MPPELQCHAGPSHGPAEDRGAYGVLCEPCFEAVQRIVKRGRVLAPIVGILLLLLASCGGRTTNLRRLRYTEAGLAMAATPVGFYLWHIDSTGTCGAEPGVECPRLYDTVDLGAAVLGIGIGCAVVALAMTIAGEGR